MQAQVGVESVWVPVAVVQVLAVVVVQVLVVVEVQVPGVAAAQVLVAEVAQVLVAEVVQALVVEVALVLVLEAGQGLGLVVYNLQPLWPNFELVPATPRLLLFYMPSKSRQPFSLIP